MAISPRASIIYTGDLIFQISKVIYFSFLADSKVSARRYNTISMGAGAGYIYKKSYIMIKVSIGLMITGNVTRVVNENSMYFSIPIKVQTYITARWFGLGLNMIYKFDRDQNYGGLGLTAGLGRMRGKR